MTLVFCGPFAALDEVYGPNKHLKFIPPPCKEKTGRKIHIEYERKDGTKISYERDVAAKEVCDCEVDMKQWPSVSADENLDENVQSYLKELIKQDHFSGRVKWKGNKKKKMEIVRQKIVQLNANKEYFQKLFRSGRKRFAWVGRNDGVLYTA